MQGLFICLECVVSFFFFSLSFVLSNPIAAVTRDRRNGKWNTHSCTTVGKWDTRRKMKTDDSETMEKKKKRQQRERKNDKS